MKPLGVDHPAMQGMISRRGRGNPEYVAGARAFLATRVNKTDDELRGLVYSPTARPKEAPGTPWYSRPATLGLIVLVATTVLNVIFW